MITSVTIPFLKGASSGTYLKITERATWAFALVSVAVRIEWEDRIVGRVRIVLGNVAGIPWRVEESEGLLAGREIDEVLALEAGEAAVSEAAPLEGTGYKVPLVKNLIKQALLKLGPSVSNAQ